MGIFSTAPGLYISQYTRGTYTDGSTKPYHWSLVILTDKKNEQGVAHQLMGGPPFFRYDDGTSRNGSLITVTGSRSFKGMVQIGQVKDKKLDDFGEILRGVVIVNEGPSQTWNCQNWIIDALPALKDKGIVENKVNEEWIRSHLNAEEELDRLNSISGA
jgi:hypothetical protein